jgi:hypothetical protein
MRFSTFLAIAACAVPLASAWTFNINMQRFSGRNCEGGSIGKREVIHGDGKCVTFKDGKGFEFKSFDYGWQAHRPREKNPKRYGDCQMHFFSEPDCGGDYRVHFQEVSAHWPGRKEIHSTFPPR